MHAKEEEKLLQWYEELESEEQSCGNKDNIDVEDLTDDDIEREQEGKWIFDVAKPPRQIKPFCNCKINESEKIGLKNFFMELPKMESHYCRALPSKKYLEPIWQTKAALYRSYIEYCKTRSIKPLSIKTFHEEFALDNLSLYAPKKDQCDLCVSYRAGNGDEQIYNQHVSRKNRARDEKSTDKSTAHRVFTMDLQSVLLCPMPKASKIYYKKKKVGSS
ncbi:uncharacterized protein LOC126750573 [Anthonomus grandis grandis]|uniref:uncharacterized protein LOC126750573 n=1 Tax=Anthonomus grandis grandis TaxID=2921223 RepID=UPI0021667401|nr:uncharacterized protein LOC126750573 [Anthonomus grandis grandis]